MPRNLPINPSVRFIHLEAKDILKSQKKGDASVCATYKMMKRFSGLTDQEILQKSISLQETQLALALDYGFKEWKALKTHVESVQSKSDVQKEEGGVGDQKKQSILIVDDESAVLEMEARALMQANYDVTTALSGTKGIKTLENHNFDLALIDRYMPEIDGLDVLKYVVAKSPATKCIILSGYPSIKDPVKAMKMGAFDYIAKPIDASELLVVVEEALKFKQPVIDAKILVVDRESKIRDRVSEFLQHDFLEWLQPKIVK
jgi:CheY-like chemotaxis protein